MNEAYVLHSLAPLQSHRRGFLFCRSAEGAEAASMLTTIIETAQANGLYPDEYLAHVFSHASDTSVSKLLPWSKDVRNVPGIRVSGKK
jgi:transposase